MKKDITPVVHPTPFVLFLRTCILWQFFRFIVINIRMTFMILKSHDTKIKKVKT